MIHPSIRPDDIKCPVIELNARFGVIGQGGEALFHSELTTFRRTSAKISDPKVEIT
jgi:hypothetical protein